jgi:hypothetical protein
VVLPEYAWTVILVLGDVAAYLIEEISPLSHGQSLLDRSDEEGIIETNLWSAINHSSVQPYSSSMVLISPSSTLLVEQKLRRRGFYRFRTPQ